MKLVLAKLSPLSKEGGSTCRAPPAFLSSCTFKMTSGVFPGGAVIKNLPANAGDTGSSPGPGRSNML